MKRALVVALLVTISACSQKSPELPLAPATQEAQAQRAKPEPLPALDARSPDALIKSYWAQQEWFRRNQSLLGLRIEFGDEFVAYLKQRIDMGTGEFRAFAEHEYAQIREAFADESPPSEIQRDIIEVRNESETRAVVLAKIRNVTPVPPNLDTSSWKEQRDYGLDVKYVVEKTSSGWRLEQAWKRDSNDVNWDKAEGNSQPKTGGWKEAWEVPKKEEKRAPGPFHYVLVEP